MGENHSCKNAQLIWYPTQFCQRDFIIQRGYRGASAAVDLREATRQSASQMQT